MGRPDCSCQTSVAAEGRIERSITVVTCDRKTRVAVAAVCAGSGNDNLAIILHGDTIGTIFGDPRERRQFSVVVERRVERTVNVISG